MSTPSRPNALGWQLVAVLALVLVSITLVALFTDKDVDAFVTPVLGFAGIAVAQLVSMRKIEDVNGKVEYLANGGMDAKVRAGVADVVKDDLLKAADDDAAAADLETDRATRAAGHKGTVQEL